MKIGLIGLGAMGQNHLRILKELNVLDSVCETDLTKLATVQNNNKDLRCVSSVTSLLSQGDLDGVVIAVPTPFHLPVATQCLEAGVHVLVEKPISDTLENAKALKDLGETHQKFIGVGYIERFNLAFQDLIKNLDQFGEITSVNIKRVGGSPRSADNVILDLMTHDIDLVMQIFNRQKPVHIASNFRTEEGIVNSAQVLMSFNNASATCEANWISPVKIREVHVTGTKGYAKIDMIRREITRISGLPHQNNPAEVLQVHDSRIFMQEPLKEELKAFTTEIYNWHLLNGSTRTPLMNAQEAIDVLETTLKVANNVSS